VSSGSSETSFAGLVLPCGGEAIAMSGTMRFRWHTTALASGSWMTTQHTSIEATGAGTITGTRHLRRCGGATTQVFAAPQRAHSLHVGVPHHRHRAGQCEK
jgi:hypothetical protein